MVAKAIKAARNKYGDRLVIVRYPKGPYSVAGVVDLLICFGGVFIAAEAKAADADTYSGHNTWGVTVKQQAFLDRIDAAGGYAFAFSSAEEFMGFLETVDSVS